MRIGKRMREILNVLKQEDPLPLKEIIEKVKRLDDNEYHEISDGAYALYSRSAKLLIKLGLVEKGYWEFEYEGYPYRKYLVALSLTGFGRTLNVKLSQNPYTT